MEKLQLGASISNTLPKLGQIITSKGARGGTPIRDKQMASMDGLEKEEQIFPVTFVKNYPPKYSSFVSEFGYIWHLLLVLDMTTNPHCTFSFKYIT